MNPQDLIYLEVKLYNWSQLSEEEQLYSITRPRGRRVASFDPAGAQNAAAAAHAGAAHAADAAASNKPPGKGPAVAQHGQSVAVARTAYQAHQGQSISAPAVMTSVTSGVAAAAIAPATTAAAAGAFRHADSSTYSSLVAAQLSSEYAIESSSDEGLEMVVPKRRDRQHQAPDGED